MRTNIVLDDSLVQEAILLIGVKTKKDMVASYEKAALIYFVCRKKGITVRSTIYCLIAQIAIEHNLFLLHNDKDSEQMAPIVGLVLYPHG